MTMTVADMILIWAALLALSVGVAVVGTRRLFKAQEETRRRIKELRDLLTDLNDRIGAFQGRNTMDMDHLRTDVNHLRADVRRYGMAQMESLVNQATGRVNVPPPANDLQRLWQSAPIIRSTGEVTAEAVERSQQPRTRYERLTDEDDLGL